MFGGRKKAPAPPSGGRDRPKRANMPLLMDVPGLDVGNELDDIMDDDDGDLEAELAALVGGGDRKVKQRPKPRKPEPDLDSMVASCMKDYDDDEDLSDTDDPDLLAELQAFDEGEEEEPQVPENVAHTEGGMLGVGHSLTETIQERLKLYKEAERVSKAAGDNSRARRFGRGVKSLQELERAALAGRPVREEDIPPEVSLKGIGGAQGSSSTSSATISPESESTPATAAPDRALPPLPSQAGGVRVAAPAAAVSSVPALPSIAAATSSEEQQLRAARAEAKEAALAAKAAGDREAALEGMKKIKVIDSLLVEVKAGRQVNLSVLSFTEAPEQRPQASPQLPPQATVQFQTGAESSPATEEIPSEASLFGSVPTPSTIQEALEQRLAKYRGEESKAKESGNSSKARRMGRICKQYEEALRLHKSGRPIPRADLPDPPGYPPIPVSDQQPQAPAAVTATAAAATTVSTGPDVAAIPQTETSGGVSPVPPTPSPQPPAARTTLGKQSSVHSSASVQSKQLEGLEKRQKLFKAAALQAKQQGQTDTAKEYLRQALAFNKLIEVSKAGLPVDMGTLPVPPQLQVKTNMDFEIVSVEDCSVTGDRGEMYSKLEQDLISQVKMCMTNRGYFKEVGDVASANKFEQMAVHAKKDLDSVRFAFKRGDPVPKFHYETRAFSRVVCNTDLTDNDLELVIVAGINYTNKNQKEAPDTYVRWEFPFPRDAPTSDRSGVVKSSTNPEYDSNHKLIINPRDKGFQRILKRGNLKVEVWTKGGFLRSDILLGTATVKLSPLETRCEIHDSFDLYDGRKPVGGKVEVRMRIRNGVIAKQIEQKQEKWLVVKF